jgi:predicted DNA-binding transcriptional regulator AlpA
MSETEKVEATKERQRVKRMTPVAQMEVIRGFGEIPDETLIPVAVLLALTGLSRPTIWKMIEEGKLPRPIVLGTVQNKWVAGEVRAALRALAAEVRDKKSIRGGYAREARQARRGVEAL